MGFGYTDWTPMVSFGGTVSASTLWISDSSLSALVPTGVSGSVLTIAVSVRRFTATAERGYEYEPPVITSFDNNVNTTMSVTGQYFGTFSSSASVRVGGTACTATLWASDSSLACNLGGGTGTALDVSVTVAGRVATQAGGFNYQRPAISHLETARGLTGGVAYIPVAGNTLISVIGAGFGKADTHPMVSVGDTRCEEVVWLSDSALRCATRAVFPTALHDVVVHTGAPGSQDSSAAVSVGASSATCKSIREEYLAVGRTSSPGFYLVDPSFASNADASLHYCAMRPEAASVATLRLATDALAAPPFMWMDPTVDDSMVMNECEAALQAQWNASVFPIGRAPCSTVQSWASRLPPVGTNPRTFTQSEVSGQPVRVPAQASTPPHLSFTGASFLTADSLRNGTELTLLMVLRLKAATGAGWLMSDNDLYADPAKGVGLSLAEGGRLVRPVVGTQTNYIANQEMAVDGFHVLTLVVTPERFELYVDGNIERGFNKSYLLEVTQDSSSSPGEAAEAGASLMEIGRRATLGFVQPLFKGDLGDVVGFGRTLASREQWLVQRALCLKWAIADCSAGADGGSLSFAGAPYVVQEQEGYAWLSVDRARASDGYLAVEYACVAHPAGHALVPGRVRAGFAGLTVQQQRALLTDSEAAFAALPGVDFIATSGVLVWGHDEMGLKNFSVPLIDNEILQEPRSFQCSLTIIEASENVALPLPSSVVIQDPYCSGNGSLAPGGCVPYRATTWNALVPDRGARGGGFNVSVLGTGFSFSRFYQCSFYSKTWAARHPGYVVTQTAAWVSATELRCVAPVWGNVQSRVGVKVLENGIGLESTHLDPSNHERSFLFTLPRVTDVDPKKSPSVGRSNLTVMGAGFGFLESLPIVTIGATTVDTTWLSDTSIRSVVPGGTGRGGTCVIFGNVSACTALLSLAVGGISPSDWTDRHSSDLLAAIALATGLDVEDMSVVSVLALSGSRRLLAQGVVVTVSMVASSGQGAAAAISTALALPPIPLGANATVYDMTVTGSVGGAFVFNAPAVFAVQPAFHPPFVSGDEVTLTLYGENFGGFDPSGVASVGDTQCALTSWVSDSIMTCVTRPGTGQNKPVRISVSGQEGVLPGAYTFRPKPVVVAVHATNAPVLGGASLAFSGLHFGMVDNTPVARVGGTACASTVWESDVSLRCASPYGWGRGVDVSVDISLESATAAALFTFDRLTISAVKPANLPPNIQSFVTVFGSNFGSNRFSRLGGNGTVEGSCIMAESSGALLWVSDSSAVCSLGPERGPTDYLKVELGRRAAVVTPAQGGPVFDAPSITDILQNDVPTVGGHAVVLLGTNFGEAAAADFRITVGNTLCLSAAWFSDTAVECRTPAGTGHVPVAASRWGLTGEGSTLLEYQAPVVGHAVGANVSYLVQTNGPTIGGVVMTVLGSGFGPSDAENQTVLIGSTATHCSAWTSDSSLGCLLRPGTGQAHALSVTVEGQASNIVAAAVDYDVLDLTGIAPVNGPPNGFPFLTVHGANFGTTPPLAAITGTVGRQACLKPSERGLAAGLDWISDSSLLCGVPPGSGVDLDVEVVIAGVPYILPKAWDYTAAPVVTGVAQSGIYPSQTGGWLTLYGARFSVQGPDGGNIDGGVEGLVGDSSCAETTWQSDSSLLCRVGPGTGTGLDVRVRLWQGIDTALNSFTYYPPPLITAVEPTAEVRSRFTWSFSCAFLREISNRFEWFELV